MIDEGHTLRKLGDVENCVLDLTKRIRRLEDFLAVSYAETPRKLAEIAAAVMREELAKR
jgi:hypothetical protein